MESGIRQCSRGDARETKGAFQVELHPSVHWFEAEILWLSAPICFCSLVRCLQYSYINLLIDSAAGMNKDIVQARPAHSWLAMLQRR